MRVYAVGVLELVDRLLQPVVEDRVSGDHDDGLKLLRAVRAVEGGISSLVGSDIGLLEIVAGSANSR